MTKVDELLIEGKVKEAIEIMCDLPEYEKEREQYIDLFENEHYRQYEGDGMRYCLHISNISETCFIAIVMKKLPQTN